MPYESRSLQIILDVVCILAFPRFSYRREGIILDSSTHADPGRAGFIKKFIPILDFFAEVCGPDCELVLHDLSRPEASIVAIRNGHISGRAVGGTMSGYAPAFVKLVRSGAYTDDMVVHVDKTRDGRILKSHAFFIKDETGGLCGMICANHDVSDLVRLHDFLHAKVRDLIGASDDAPAPSMPLDAVLEADSDSNIEDIMDVLIEQASSEMSSPPAEMNPDERARLVSMLKTRHLFSMKGAVAKVADRLGVSEATVYRYLKRERL